MVYHTIQAWLRKALPRFVSEAIRSLATAVLTPVYFSMHTGHFRSSLRRRAIDPQGNAIPWYTYPTIDFLKYKEYTGRAVLEFGTGNLPTGGPAARCASFHSRPVEAAVVEVEHDALEFAFGHPAGLNRGDEAEIESTNVALTRDLIETCEREQVRPHIVFANSTHSDRDTAYGRSKRESVKMLSAWAARAGTRFTDLVIPGVFGEGGRPFYNSVVSTFCHQLANGEAPRIIEDREIDLVHAQALSARIVSIVRQGESGVVRIPGRVMTVSALLDRLKKLAGEYGAHVLPSVSDRFSLELFNTYRSYLFPKHYPMELERRADARGSLFEVVRTLHGGQCFFSTTKPGITRGNHYHTAKIERFLVAQGEAIIRLRRLFSTEVHEFRVSGDSPVYIDMPTFCTHNITNVGSGELLTLFWAHEIFDPTRPDTYPEPV